jgi:RES domain-containing protein
MLVYRIAKSGEFAENLLGMGAFYNGGRWNNIGAPILYTAINSSLAYLECLVHFAESITPPQLFITEIEIREDVVIYQLPDTSYPKLWQILACKGLGDSWMNDKQYLAFRVRSAVNPSESNILLNPLYRGYEDLVKLLSVTPVNIDTRLLR